MRKKIYKWGILPVLASFSVDYDPLATELVPDGSEGPAMQSTIQSPLKQNFTLNLDMNIWNQ